VSLPLESPAQIGSGIRAHLQGPQHRSKCCLDVGCLSQPLLQRWIDDLPNGETLDRDQVPGHSAESGAVNFEPHGIGPAGIRIERRDAEG
jgi:hypothetical protein